MSALSEYEELRSSAFENMKRNGLKYLQFLESSSLNKPNDVLIIGNYLIENNIISTNNKWRLLERITISALELDDKKTAAICIKKLTEKFTKNSNRVRILRGMFYETKNEIKKANDEYNFILDTKNDPNHMMAHKRRIALQISSNNKIQAIKLLCEYLKLYGSDYEAWKELIILYGDIHNYELCKFSLEELITIQHNNYVLFQLYAEQLYNLGGKENLRLALKYFSQSLLLSSDKNTRSLYGIILTVNALKGSKGGISGNDKELIKISAQKLIKNYADSKSKLVNIVKNVLLDFTDSTN